MRFVGIYFAGQIIYSILGREMLDIVKNFCKISCRESWGFVMLDVCGIEERNVISFMLSRLILIILS